ncbi:hypothetical protein D9M70_529530 [compost metagenome]
MLHVIGKCRRRCALVVAEHPLEHACDRWDVRAFERTDFAHLGKLPARSSTFLTIATRGLPSRSVANVTGS